MNRKTTFAEGEYYHIYNRGVEKRDVYLDDKERTRFQRSLRISNSKKPVVYKLIQGYPLDKFELGDRIVAVGAYVLMPNHFHLLVKETSEKGISMFMEKLMTGYSSYFNKKHDRVGPLFQRPFKAEHVDNDEYLKYLYAYIHLNPVKLIDPKWKENGIRDREAAKQYLGRYDFSSYLDYSGREREEAAILTKEEFPDYFSVRTNDFEDYINDWLEFGKEEHLEQAEGDVLFG